MPIAVNDQSDEIKALALEWPILEALQGGTPAMRKAGALFMPRWPNEEDAAYNARLATATLFPAYRRTVSVMAGKPFSKEITLSEDTPPTVKEWAEDIDQQGVSLHAFSAELFQETIGYGLCGILVDYPDMTPRDAKGAPMPAATMPVETVAAREASGARPYMVRVFHKQILGYRAALIGGKMRLTMLRLMESREVEDGEWGTKHIPVVRVLRPGSWATYEEVVGTESKKTWVLTGQGVTTLDQIPFVPLYGVRDGFMCGKAPLLDLAYLNVKHWQSQSDQDTITHVARVPILAIMGAEDSTALVVGTSSAVKLPLGSDMKFVEHTGAAIEAGSKSLLDLEEQMIQTGAELMVKKPGDRTATESANDAEANKSDLQRIAENFEDGLNQALEFMAQFANLPDAGDVSLFKDYGAATLSDASAALVADLQSKGLLSKATALKEMQRRGVIDAGIDIEAELADAEADGPPLGTMGMPAAGKPDIDGAVSDLSAAIALHEKHMNGTAPTTGAAGDASQQKMMDQMTSALDALNGGAMNPSMKGMQ